jgi:ribosomal protein S18 acetylase RimI-like enzyme
MGSGEVGKIPRDMGRERGVQIEFEQTTLADAESLIDMRLLAMRASLEHVGRFDRVRARERFLSTFDPSTCRTIRWENMSVGFAVVRRRVDHLLLDHLYILPAFQGRGIGAAVLVDVFADADTHALPVLVGALRESGANRFYQRHGFVKVGEREWDIYYVRSPRP